MTAKKAHTDTMILLVVPLGFCTGTELLKTRPQSSQMALPMVKEGPPGSARQSDRREGRGEKERLQKEELARKTVSQIIDTPSLYMHFLRTAVVGGS